MFAKFHFSSSPVTCNLHPGQKLGCQSLFGLFHNNVLPSGMFLHTVAHCDMPDEFVRTCVHLLLQLFQDPVLRAPFPDPCGGGTDTDKFNFVRPSQDGSHRTCMPTRILIFLAIHTQSSPFHGIRSFLRVLHIAGGSGLLAL